MMVELILDALSIPLLRYRDEHELDRIFFFIATKFENIFLSGNLHSTGYGCVNYYSRCVLHNTYCLSQIHTEN